MITIQVDTKEVTRLLNDIQRKQIPFATSVALNKTAQDVQTSLVSAMGVFDRPKPFTLRGVYVSRSTKANLTATIGLKTRDKGGPVSEYLSANITGGGRVDKRSEILLRNAGILPAGMQTRPGPDAKLDAYGNMSRGQIVKIISHFRAFGSIAASGRGKAGGTQSATLNRSTRKPKAQMLFVTPSGIYERRGKTVLGLITFIQPQHYRKTYDFKGIATTVAQRKFDRNFDSALAHALSTAR
jgi:hypothetical protein